MTFKSNLNPTFRSKFAEDIFNHKYRHEGCETWRDLCRTLVNDVCRDFISQEDKDELVEHIYEMRFIPGGRYLYYAGRKKKYFNNCATYETKVLTDTGWVKMGEVVGKTLNVLSPVTGQYLPATFYEHGKQPVNKITFAPVRGKSNIEYEVKFTPNHKWLLKDGSTTESLKIGDVVPANFVSLDRDDWGFAHGFIFGDGNSNGQLRLCADKDLKHLARLSSVTKSVTYPKFSNGDPVLYFNNHTKWKELPPEDSTPEYIASFIEGWIAADGCNDRMLCSVNEDALKWFRKYAAYCGIVISGELRNQVRDVKLGKYEYKDHKIYVQNFSRGHVWQGFKVINIENIGEETVYCPYEPIHNQIVIDHNIRTYQCFLLKAEEDTREDWAELSKKAELCLTTGGGIGVDYSIYRHSGQILHGTGGTASGPIPKMYMINEIGQNVIQGGSRRSAIYASLNWKHGDIQKFLVAKNWYDMPVAGTDKTMGQLKEADFNFKCPLDMTNISVNYDTEWLLKYWKTGDVGEVFRKNVYQALNTGEPGFSFNFFNREKETLRNACTEVTSEDDSDVCNLGSVNFSRIANVDQLHDVVELATKFLICGTLRADLPYDKVAAVRKKNRRLGLGLMGLHEWLISRGSKYEVTPELHRWLSVYKGVSDRISKAFASELDISIPIANRAIAPTGSIGILAGTTTGIEPIFAVAYKRRYLKGSIWRYQYVVDSAAQTIIDLYGTNPDNIETALDLANDYERRIKFQADVQDYVDMSISSTINLPKWGSNGNNPDMVDKFTKTLAGYAHRLRGFTCYPDGSRGGQPLTSVTYNEAKDRLGEEFDENVQTVDICDITGRGGSCGV